MEAAADFSTRSDHDHALDVPCNSPAIARLIEEVRGTDVEVTRSYNRTYNRHNR